MLSGGGSGMEWNSRTIVRSPAPKIQAKPFPSSPPSRHRQSALAKRACHLTLLPDQQTGKDELFRRHLCQMRGQLDERIGEDIGNHQVEDLVQLVQSAIGDLHLLGAIELRVFT